MMDEPAILNLDSTTPEASQPFLTSFLDQARLGKNDWWRYVISLVWIFVLWQILGAIPYGILLVLNLTQNTFISYVALNFSFILLVIAIITAVRFFHRRPIRTLISSDLSFDWYRALLACGIWMAISLVIALVDALLHPGVYEFTFNLQAWLPFAVFGLILTPIQTTAEELLFRGYLLQSFALPIKNKWLITILSGVVFAVPHFLNPEMKSSFILLALFYFCFGVFLTLITIKENRLEAAIGVHAANNLFLVVIANYKDSALMTSSIFTSNQIEPLFNLVSFIIGAVVFWFVMNRYFAQPTLQLQGTDEPNP